MTCRILNPDGTRYWDWAVWRGPEGQALIPYDWSDYSNVYITGGFIVAQRYVFEQVLWDDTKGFYEQEDIDFSERLKRFGYRIQMNVHSSVVHHGPYTQQGDYVIRKREELPILGEGEKMRVLWYSVPPWNNTGYGVQTRQYVQGLMDMGHEVRILPFTQLKGAPNIEWEGFKLMATGNYEAGLDALLYYTEAWRPHVVVSLLDVWPLPDDLGLQIKMAGGRWCPITPVDTFPLSPELTKRLAFAHLPIAMSQHGYRMMKEAKLEPAYVPHGVDQSIFHPGVEPAFTQERFVVGMVAANVGSFDRKGFQQALESFARLDPEDYYFYIHTDPLEFKNSVHISSLAKELGVELHFPDVWQYYQGFSPQFMAKLFKAFDVLLMGSRGEGFGIPLIEAQSVGTPVIATKFSSMAELAMPAGRVVQPRGNIWTPVDAWMAEPDPTRMASAIEQMRYLKTQKYAWEDIADRAIKFSHAYDVDVVNHAFLEPTLLRAARTP